MKAATIIRAAAVAALLAWTPAAAVVKYVAVVEADVDAASGASAVINPAEVREITAELRRQAVEHLPSDKYRLITSETIQSFGGAVLEECTQENCVILLGARIGADFIVRATINKFGAKLTLAVEMYETDNGTLVASSEAVRAQGIEELLDRGSVACVNMFKKFVVKQNAGQRPAAAADQDEYGQAGKKGKPKKEKTPASAGGELGEGEKGSGWKEQIYRMDYALKYQFPVGTPVSWGAVDVELEFIWNGREVIIGGMDMLLGIDSDWRLLGYGVNVGKVYNLWNQTQLVYGGSLGALILIGYAHPSLYTFLAPCVKYRWRFLEVSAAWRLGLGWEGESVNDGYSTSETKSKFYHSPQIMAGFYIKGRTVTTTWRTQVSR